MYRVQACMNIHLPEQRKHCKPFVKKCILCGNSKPLASEIWLHRKCKILSTQLDSYDLMIDCLLQEDSPCSTKNLQGTVASLDAPLVIEHAQLLSYSFSSCEQAPSYHGGMTIYLTSMGIHSDIAAQQLCECTCLTPVRASGKGAD